MVVNLARSVRSLALKIASYGVMHLVVAMIVAFAITRDWRMALAIGVVEPFFQTIAYSFHDRVWHRIERRRMGSSIEETAEAFTARLNVMDATAFSLCMDNDVPIIIFDLGPHGNLSHALRGLPIGTLVHSE